MHPHEPEKPPVTAATAMLELVGLVGRLSGRLLVLEGAMQEVIDRYPLSQHAIFIAALKQRIADITTARADYLTSNEDAAICAAVTRILSPRQQH